MKDITSMATPGAANAWEKKEVTAISQNDFHINEKHQLMAMPVHPAKNTRVPGGSTLPTHLSVWWLVPYRGSLRTMMFIGGGG